MPSSVLLVDDDPALLNVVSLSLEEAGYAVRQACDGQTALDLQRAARSDVIISDVNMPRLDGFALCRKLRAATDATPLILLTSRDSEIDEALGLELGADDYISKPFSTRILLARVAALLRREELSKSVGSTKARLVAGALELDPDRLECRYGGTPIRVTVTEFRLLEALARRPGILHSRDSLLQQIRDDNCIVVERIIDTYVRRLRRKIELVDPAFDRIETVVGVGYRWRE